MSIELAKSERPSGRGVGLCHQPTPHGRCGCKASCAFCGHPLHTAIHMHVSGERIGDPPYGHEFVPKDGLGQLALDRALGATP